MARLNPDDTPNASGAIFGNRHLARVLAVAADLGEEHVFFTARQIAVKTGVADSVVRANLLRLIDGGVITRVARKPGERQVYLAVEETPLAQAVVFAARLVSHSEQSQRSTEPAEA